MDYPNSGALWPNKKKLTDKHPNTQGSIKLERGFLKELMNNTDSEIIEVALSGWTREYDGGKFISLKASKPFVKGEQAKPAQQQPQEDDDEIPF
jgi:hypothetical protein